ncbi:MAG: tetratricopeptide repeat protein [Candidatus Cloacimonadaceae bacterium]|nr:tetratricopeptide repeat protein [Candidatus Cloacimonadaceae bacterium]
MRKIRGKLLGIILFALLILLLLYIAFEVFIRRDALSNSRGIFDFARAKYANAENIFRKNALRNVGDDIASGNLAKSFYKQENYDEAEKAFKNALPNAKDPAQEYYNLGNSQFRQENYEEALKAYREALLLNPNDQDTKANYELALIARQQQQQQKQDGDQDKKEQDKKQEEKPQESQDKEELRNRLRALDQKESSDRRRQQKGPTEQNRNWW